MAENADDESSVVLGHNGERVLPTHGSAHRNRAHEEQLQGPHGSQADEQSMRRFDPLGSFRPSTLGPGAIREDEVPADDEAGGSPTADAAPEESDGG